MGRKVNQAELDKQAMMQAIEAAVSNNSSRLFDHLIAGDLSEKELVRAASRCVIEKKKAFLAKILAKKADWAGVEGIGDALLDAAIHGAPAMARMLVDAGAPVDAQDSYGSTSLLSAAARNGYETVKLLVKHGANLNYQAGAGNFEGWTSLHMAALMGDIEMVKLLAGLGANPNLGNKEGATPLMVRAKSSQEPNGQGKAFVDALLAVGADIDAVDAQGYSAAMWAASARNHEVLEGLLANGIDKAQKSSLTGVSILECALARDIYGNRDRCAWLLLEAGVDVERKVKLTPKGRLINFSELARRNGYEKIHGFLAAKSEAAKIAKSIKVSKVAKTVGVKSL